MISRFFSTGNGSLAVLPGAVLRVCCVCGDRSASNVRDATHSCRTALASALALAGAGAAAADTLCRALFALQRH